VAIAAVFACLPCAPLVGRVSLLIPLALLAMVTATLAGRYTNAEVKSVPRGLDFLMGMIGAVATQAAGAFTGILVYGVFLFLTKLSGYLLPANSIAARTGKLLPLVLSLIIVILTVIGSSGAATRNLLTQLYPQTAGLRTAFYSLLSFRRKLSIAIVAAMPLLFVIGMLLVFLFPGLERSWWFEFAVAYALILIGGPLGKVGEGSETRVSRESDSVAEAVKKLFEGGGYQVVPYPRTGEEDLDPFLAGTPDLYAENRERAFAITVSSTKTSPARLGITALSELTSAAWALTEFSERNKRERKKIVEPLVVLVGQAPPPEVRAYEKKGSLRVLTIDSTDLLKRVMRTNNYDELQTLARDYLELSRIGV